MARPKALDLFCGGGGAARGLIAAGFDVVGIDHDLRCGKHYPCQFIQADLSKGVPLAIEYFDLAWASPPCQKFTAGNNGTPHVKKRYPDYLDLARGYLARAPFSVLENVPGAPIRHDLGLVGPMFGLDRLRRLRYFELNFFCLQPPWVRSPEGVVTVLKSYSSVMEESGYKRYHPTAVGREVMGIPPGEMSRSQIGEAVPPAYAEFIGRQVRPLIEGAAP